jgi:2-polyprenyl-6-methoxyphenol hydroxylase-like FAD-dependent oxidoreductase
MHAMATSTEFKTTQERPNEGTDPDVVVVGARCAGAATAMLLARQGLDVLVVDRADLPSDTLSTHALSRGAVVELRRWELLDDVLASGAPKIHEVTFHVGEDEPVVKTVKNRAGVDSLLAPRRYVLDAILLDAAREAGAAVQTGVAACGVTRDASGRVNGVMLRQRDGEQRTVRTRLVVGADGVWSRIARLVGARVVDERPSDGATLYTYATGLHADGYEFHATDRGFAGVFPTHDGQVNLWMCVPADRALTGSGARADGFMNLLGTIAPSLGARARAATITAPVRSAVRYPNHVREAAGPGWALVGDAAEHRDPITGHGITDAFRDAELLASHLGRALRGEAREEDSLASYDAERLRALKPIFDITCKMGAYPPLAEFSDLQRELSLLLELEAEWLASLPDVPSRGGQVAA